MQTKYDVAPTSILYAGGASRFPVHVRAERGMTGYGWDKYDPRSGGIQTIHDAVNEVEMGLFTTSFVKVSDAGDRGGNLAVRVKGSPRTGGRG